MKKSTKILLLQLSFAFNHLGRNIKYMVTDFILNMKDAYYFYKGNYDLKQFGSREEKNITWKWIKREN